MPQYLKVGSRGPDVASLQHDLNWLCMMVGDTLDEDGKFGPITKSKVMEFQYQEKIKVDGIVGPETRLAIATAAARRAGQGAVPPQPKPKGEGKPRPGTPPKPKPISDRTPMSKEDARKFIKENLTDPGALTEKQLDNVVRTMWSWGNGLFFLPRFAAAVGIINTTAGVGMAIPPIAAIAGIIGSLVSWNRALESSECVYGYRGLCYAMTWEVWSLRVNGVTGRLYQDGFAPTSSPEMKNRILRTQFEKEFKPTNPGDMGWFTKANYQDCWDKGVGQARRAIDHRKPPGAKDLEWRLAIQLLGKERTPQEFCKGIMRTLTPQIKSLYPAQVDVWERSIRSGPVYPA